MMLQRMWMRGMAGGLGLFVSACVRGVDFYDCHFPVTEIASVNGYAPVSNCVHRCAAVTMWLHCYPPLSTGIQRFPLLFMGVHQGCRNK